MEWGSIGTQIITAALGSTLGFGMVQLIYNHIKGRRDEQRRARYLALLIVIQLEDYAERCWTLLANHMMWVQQNGQQGTQLDGVPMLGERPASTDYQLLQGKHLDRYYGFPQRWSNAVDNINSAREHLIPDLDDEWWECFDEQVLLLMREALDLAGQMRKDYGLGDRDGNPKRFVDLKDFIESTLTDIEEEDRKRIELRRELDERSRRSGS